MIPAGYMAKHVEVRTNWLNAGQVVDVFSVSNCISGDFGKWIKGWKHNQFWLFDSPGIIRQVAQERCCFLVGTSLFYYEVYELEYDTEDRQWYPVEPDRSFPIEVIPPTKKVLEGYDIVTCTMNGPIECSPLSCNSIASEVETNQHCLLYDLGTARRLLEEGYFDAAEPGPYRIFAVYSTEWT